MSKSTSKCAGIKPKRNGCTPPYKGFPLSCHGASGRLFKTIHQRRYYSVNATDWKAAVDKFEAEWESTRTGWKRRHPHENGISLGDLCSWFLHAKKVLLASDERALRSWYDYKSTTDRLVRVFGVGRPVADLAPDDFSALRRDITKPRGPIATKTEITRTHPFFIGLSSTA